MQAARSNSETHSWCKDICFLTLILGSLFFILLGTRPLFVPDEGRYAEIAREMISRSDYVTPYLNSIKYFEKPIFFYWLGAAAIKIGGLNLWSLRSINALLGLLGCLLTYFTARKLYDRKTGLLAALILGTSTLYFVMAHMISLDLPVTVLIAACLFAFILGIQHPPSLKRRFYLWGASAAAALAVLTKGLIGLVFPGMIIFVWILLLNDWRILKQLYLPSCIVIFLLIAAPWHVLVGERNPEFFYFYFVQQHFLRYTTKDVGHYQPVWFFLPTLAIGYFPWLVFLPQALAHALPRWRERVQHKNELFFLLWAVLIFIFFSFSKSKLIPYILPVLPPLAILTAVYLKTAIADKKIGLKIGFICLVIISAFFSYVLYHFIKTSLLPDKHWASIWLNIAGSILLIGSLYCCYCAFSKPCRATLTLVGVTWLFLISCLIAIPAIDNRTILPLANKINSVLQPADEVVAYDQYYQDLPFYVKRKITILNWQNELTYGMQHQDTSDWMIDDATFWQRWKSDKRLFVIMDMDNFHQLGIIQPNVKYYVLDKTNANVLISNKP